MFSSPGVLRKSKTINMNLIKSLIDAQIIGIFNMLNQVPLSVKEDKIIQTENLQIDDSYQQSRMEFPFLNYPFQRFQPLSSVNSAELRSNSPFSQIGIDEKDLSRASSKAKQKLTDHQSNSLNNSRNLQSTLRVSRRNSKINTKNTSYEKILAERKKRQTSKKREYAPRERAASLQILEKLQLQIAGKYRIERGQDEQEYLGRKKMIENIEQIRKKTSQFKS